MPTGTWTVNSLADETGLDRRTIKKVLTEGGAAPVDTDGKCDYYRLRDFIQALISYHSGSDGEDGNYEKERTRKTALEADILEVDRAERRNEVIDAAIIDQVWDNVATAIRRTIETANLTNAEKDSIFTQLQSVTIEAYVEQRKLDQGAAPEAE